MRQEMGQLPAGMLPLLKPAGMSSHDVVQFVRRLGGEKKVGHAGTLDPAAAGVLPLFVGAGTRVIQYLGGASKAYAGEFVLGIETTTLDTEGDTLHTAAVPPAADLERRLSVVEKKFQGIQEQRVPRTSAVKVKGKPLYAYFREGLAVEPPLRQVTIHQLQLQAGGQEVRFYVHCSKGTYIRSLVRDLGRALGSCATLNSLVRVRHGALDWSECLTLQELQEAAAKGQLAGQVWDLNQALAHLPALELAPEEARGVRYGRQPRLRQREDGPAHWWQAEWLRLLSPQGELLAVAQPEVQGEQLQPRLHKVFVAR